MTSASENFMILTNEHYINDQWTYDISLWKFYIITLAKEQFITLASENFMTLTNEHYIQLVDI